MISQPVSSIFSLFSTALWDLVNSRPVHSLMLSSHLFLCLPCLLLPFTVPCKMVLARPDERETCTNNSFALNASNICMMVFRVHNSSRQNCQVVSQSARQPFNQLVNQPDIQSSRLESTGPLAVRAKERDSQSSNPSTGIHPLVQPSCQSYCRLTCKAYVMESPTCPAEVSGVRMANIVAAKTTQLLTTSIHTPSHLTK